MYTQKNIIESMKLNILILVIVPNISAALAKVYLLHLSFKV